MNVCGHAKRLVWCASCPMVAARAYVLYPMVKAKKFPSIEMTIRPTAVEYVSGHKWLLQGRSYFSQTHSIPPFKHSNRKKIKF